MAINRQAVQDIIRTREKRESLVGKLGRETVLAFDLEADSMHHYREKVCLVQVATSSDAYLIDPLALPDMSPHSSLLANPAIRKVFHGADYDVRSLRRDFSLEINNLFDTMIACQFLGEKEVGLAATLKKRFGVELDKRFQKADWSKRPLEPAMIEYALADTSLLVALYRQLEEELKAKGRVSWVEEESGLVARAAVAEREKTPFFRRFRGADKMDGRTLAVLEELLKLRDRKAQLYDRPPFKILAHETLFALAQNKPLTQTELHGIPGLSAKLAERYGTEILKSVARGTNTPEGRLPCFPREERPKKDRVVMERCSRLKMWREAKSSELGIDAGVLASNSLFAALASCAPRDMAELGKVGVLRNWQRTEFGEELLRALSERG